MKKLLFFVAAALALAACTNAPAQESKTAIETIMSRKSVRSFTGAKISDEQVTTLLKAAMAAPTAGNSQPWRFVVVNDDAVKMTLPGANNGDAFKTSAVVIVVCGAVEPERRGPDGSVQIGPNNFWFEDCSAAAENLLLAAEAMDLGAVWLSCYPNAPKVAAVQAALGLPAEIVPLCIIPVGVPNGEFAPKDKWVPEKIHYNKW